MLTHLHISDFAIIDEVTLSFGPGFNVLTGETGAGKSILVEAVELLRGGRGRPELIRAGAEEAVVEAQFEGLGADIRQCLAARGLPSDDEPLLVRRHLARAGRGRVYIAGALSTVATLDEVVGALIDVSGQHEHQSLTRPACHLELVDAFAGATRLREEMAAAYQDWRQAVERQQAAQVSERDRAEREDFLGFQLSEIDRLDPHAGEEAELRAERERLRAAERLKAAGQRGEEVLYGRQGAVIDELTSLARQLGELAPLDQRLAPLAERLEGLRAECEDVAAALRRYGESVDEDPERLLRVEERLHLLGKLLRKHGPTVEDLLRRAGEMRDQLAALSEHERRSQAEQLAVESAAARATDTARRLSTLRRRASDDLGRQVGEVLRQLGMARAELRVELRPRGGDGPFGQIGPSGADQVELLFSANAGEEPRPLGRVASGGELSRLMLAVKRVLARSDPVPTYIFDEVDAGVGGAVAEVLGRHLAEVASEHQVLCITHLPQIAALATVHYRVEKHERVDKDGRGEKQVHGDRELRDDRQLRGDHHLRGDKPARGEKEEGEARTVAAVRRLGDDEREQEIARMLAGITVTAQARANAAEMLRLAQQQEAQAVPGRARPARRSSRSSARHM